MWSKPTARGPSAAKALALLHITRRYTEFKTTVIRHPSASKSSEFAGSSFVGTQSGQVSQDGAGDPANKAPGTQARPRGGWASVRAATRVKAIGTRRR